MSEKQQQQQEKQQQQKVEDEARIAGVNYNISIKTDITLLLILWFLYHNFK